MIAWVEWIALDQPPNYFKAAVYQIRLVIDGKPFPIPRLVSTDRDCVMMIGETGNMTARRSDFLAAVRCGRAKHSEGNLWYFILKFSRLVKTVGQPMLEYRYATCPSKDEAVVLETALLKDYVVRFGELPPLNCTIRDRYSDDANWCEMPAT